MNRGSRGAFERVSLIVPSPRPSNKAHLLMRTHLLWTTCCLLALHLTLPTVASCQSIVNLWPEGQMPGRVTATGTESDTSTAESNRVAGKSVIRLGNVAEPTLAVYLPKENNTGAAVLICPGGGYHILAMDLEGTEVAEWLNTLGVAGIVLKYRVPRGGTDVPAEPLMDAQRALSLIRSRAAEWSIDPQRIGVLGFSAGGNLAARLSTSHARPAYPAIDGIDQASPLPDFSLLIYPAYLFDKDAPTDKLLTDNLPIDEHTPPAFITMAQDDPVDSENALRYALALKRASRPVELHLYASGGHGYGLRPTEVPATRWTEPAAAWLKPFMRSDSESAPK